MSDYPIGATWKATSSTGKVGIVWLEKRSSYFEMWRWLSYYSDGSGREGDWNTSKRKAIFECKCTLSYTEKIRFKRVKRSVS